MKICGARYAVIPDEARLLGRLSPPCSGVTLYKRFGAFDLSSLDKLIIFLVDFLSKL